MRFMYIFLILFVLFTCIAAVNAEMYEYRDQAGYIRVTDDFGSIPEKFRESARIFQEIPGSSPSSDRPVAVTNNNNVVAEVDPAGQIADMIKERDALKKTYDYIQEEKIRISGNQPGPNATKEERDAYIDEVDALNQQILDYRENVEDYENRVKIFNARSEQ